MEVRVRCVPAPGAQPQNVCVRIHEPAKKSPAPLSKDGSRSRCPSLSEKDFYRKIVPSDRRDRYLTLCGAEIGRNLGEILRNGKRDVEDRQKSASSVFRRKLMRGLTIGKCPLEDGLDVSLAPWPGMKWNCIRILHLYCKVFDQSELFELIVR